MELGAAEATLAGQMAKGRAKLQLMKARQEMALRYKEQVEKVREVVKFEVEAMRLKDQKVATSAYVPGMIRPAFHLHMKKILSATGICQPVDAEESPSEFVIWLAEGGASVSFIPQ